MLHPLEKNCGALAGIEEDGVNPHCDCCGGRQSSWFWCSCVGGEWVRWFLCGACRLKLIQKGVAR